MKKDKLFDLIKQMTKQEKIFFNRFSKLLNSNSEKDYVKLFSAIEKQTKKSNQIDDKALKNTFKNLSFKKNYLMSLLLQALVQFHKEKQPLHRIREWTQQIEILIQKEGIVEAERLLKKASKLAYEYECFYELLVLKKLQVSLISERPIADDTIERIDAILLEKSTIRQKMDNLEQYARLVYLLLDFQRKYYSVDNIDKENKLTVIQEHVLLENSEKALSVKALGFYYLCHNAISILKRDFINGQLNYQQHLNFLEQHQDKFIKKNKLVAYGNYLIFCINTKDEQAFNSGLTILKTLQSQSPHEEAYKQYAIHVRSLTFNSNIGYFKDNQLLLQNIEEMLNEQRPYLPQKHQDNLSYSIGRAYMELGMYHDALQWLLPLYKVQFIAQETAWYYAIRLLTIISYYELQLDSNLESELRSTYRLMRKHKALTTFRFYDAFLVFLRKVQKAITPKEVLLVMEDLYLIWSQIENNPKENSPFDFFHYTVWLKSKIDKRTFMDYFPKHSA